ncbi:hypothetical protein MZO42_20260 [Sphingomonas psychrotolerans]|uniref:DUF4139 domain-containing protein n=1 Tax=Sphingomonas psychrotolerans TaxID=1327635 RepID=A0ABU3N950_9SPHN|nr:hypothetical protein [Sphingomonas psychrotolerans]MDT8761040.1 hypothetical protein [Sphingomonas psychrotolerans]
MRRILPALALLAAASPAAGQVLVESDRIESVSVTLYRDPGRGDGAIPSGGWPGGYALITETRTIAVPAGKSVIRFVGVSEGMMPETAIVTGLPQQVGEKNRDARLLSPAALIDAYLKRRVTIRRTNRATGKVTEGEAIIQSGPGGGVLLTTDGGVEALGCSGLPEGLKYPGVPADLSAKPTLSVTTDSANAATVRVQISYLAQGFDWSANYVAQVAEDGETLDLFAWLTVANGGSQGFVGASTNAVAGAPHKEAAAVLPKRPAPELHLRCWPMDTTSTYPRWSIERMSPPDVMLEVAGAEDIVVSGSLRRRAMPMAMPAPAPPPAPVMMAQQEELGDLKLYRIPEPVTVAALSRKQVAMIDRKEVRFARIYTGIFRQFGYSPAGDTPSFEAARILRTRNVEEEGLGLPLPAGRVAVFERAREESLLIGESDLADRAIGEEVEFATGQSSDLRYRIIPRPPSKTRLPFTVEVSNARSTPETFEMPLPFTFASIDAKLVEHKGVKTWRAIVPANGTARLEFALKLDNRR